MSKPTQRARNARLMELMRIIDAETYDLNAIRRRIAEMKRHATRLVRGDK
jgi:hypothetical protein